VVGSLAFYAAALDETSRHVLEMKYLQCLTYKEIGVVIKMYSISAWVRRFLVVVLIATVNLILANCHPPEALQQESPVPSNESPRYTDLGEFATEQPEAMHPTAITIKGIEYRTTLTELDLSGAGLVDADIADLKYMDNLTRLSLGSGVAGLSPQYKFKISDVSPLRHLKDLEYLDLSNNLISNIEPLKDLTKLKNLVTVQVPTGQIEKTFMQSVENNRANPDKTVNRSCHLGNL
jgi:hypothetical protein